jgi:hypothetical protein
MSSCGIGEMPSGGDSVASGSRGSGSGGSGSGGSGSGGSGSGGSSSAHELAYVPGPLQPNNCGTPDTFKACRVASYGSRERVVVVADRSGAPISATNSPRKPVVVIEELDDRGGEPVSATNDPLWQGDRAKAGDVLVADPPPFLAGLDQRHLKAGPALGLAEADEHGGGTITPAFRQSASNAPLPGHLPRQPSQARRQRPLATLDIRHVTTHH